MSLPGVFVVLEGVDGSGTTTQLDAVRQALEARGVSVLATREPTPGPIGRFLREALAKRLLDEQGRALELDWAAMALLFAADRVDHVEREIRPALERGEWVLSDRYDLSSIVYQSATSPLGDEAVEWLRALNSRALRPTLTLVLTLDPEVAAARRRARGGPEELYERAELQVRLGRGYAAAQRLLPDDAITFIDAAGSREQVTADILAALTKWLPSPSSIA
ncbi:MAG TPA: dTMP kinase [Polyangiaceae bacterium]|nr:dTMP kinase [Polyangiaceae bacterium]